MMVGLLHQRKLVKYVMNYTDTKNKNTANRNTVKNGRVKMNLKAG